MKKIHLFVALSAILITSSCAPIYKCGEATPEKKIMAGKRFKTVISERDQLCGTVKLREEEIGRQKARIDELSVQKSELITKSQTLENENTDLMNKYNDLINENLSQANKYDKALQAKSEELNAKEKLLSEREKALKELREKLSRQDSITKRLNDIIRNALLGFNSDELSVEVKDGKVYVSMSDKLLFKSGSATIETKGKDALKLLSDVLSKNSDIDILVEGHTDSIPIKTAVYKDNWDLSVVRATSIVRILTEDYKIPATRVVASGRGEYFPKASNETAEGRAKNRRTEIILSPKLDEIMKLINTK
ncbi:MAG: OmpA family protein [bacterium]|nr:OmpA family protein [bacterium]